MELSLPADFERLPEYRAFLSKLLQRSRGISIPVPWTVEMAALFIFVRLWVDLAYQAQSTKPLGFLPEDSMTLFVSALGREMGEFEPVSMLVEAGILRAENGGHLCERFARCNPHLSPDFKSGQTKGAEHSALVRGKRRVAHEAMQQAMLLPASAMKRRDGRPIEGADVNRCLIIIRTLDNCLKLAARNTANVGEGLLADAAEVMDRYTPEQLEATYFWIIDHRDHPALPKTTEQLLQNFGALAGLVNS
jgi:hypothetical protein